ncbi:MAG: MBL fold metallo-hydrolase [Clostridia bacterium]|nr:MBL fold metallo-hydrolase [Clostridia bacterium]
MRIVNLASGSKGNSTFVHYGDTRILIDAGLTEKKLQETLAEIGENISDIQGVCITHEHIDHIRAVKTLAKKYDMVFYVRKELAESSAFSDVEFKEGKLFKFENDVFSVGEFEVKPFEVSHDAVKPVGFTVRVFGNNSKAGFVTDLGVVSETVKRELLGAKIVFIESNYDEKMLFGGKYPKIIKNRIDGTQGHLSNEQSLELAKFLFDGGTKCFVLSHISENNNTPELAYLNYANYFESQGFVLDKDIFIRLSFQNRHGNNFKVKEENDGE